MDNVTTNDNNKQLITLSVQMGYVQKSVDTVEKKLDDLTTLFVTRSEFKPYEDQAIAFEKKIANIEARIYVASGALAAIVFILKFFFK